MRDHDPQGREKDCLDRSSKKETGSRTAQDCQTFASGTNIGWKQRQGWEQRQEKNHEADGSGAYGNGAPAAQWLRESRESP